MFQSPRHILRACFGPALRSWLMLVRTSGSLSSSVPWQPTMLHRGVDPELGGKTVIDPQRYPHLMERTEGAKSLWMSQAQRQDLSPGQWVWKVCPFCSKLLSWDLSQLNSEMKIALQVGEVASSQSMRARRLGSLPKALPAFKAPMWKAMGRRAVQSSAKSAACC